MTTSEIGRNFLSEVRRDEARRVAPLLAGRRRVLDVGGGIGIQARALSELGFDVTSIDLPSSIYVPDRVWPVLDYDGLHFPLGDGSVDAVFSSNVLEHVIDLAGFHSEVRRVLGPTGVVLHVVPTPTWRVASALAHPFAESHEYINFVTRSIAPHWRAPLIAPFLAARALPSAARAALRIPRHGERGSALSEVWSFSPIAWRRHFAEQRFRLLDSGPMGSFFTGHPVFDRWLTEPWRETLAKVAGSACFYFLLEPLAEL